jgi:NADH dehydrogenase FAD-containing subunit
MSTGLSIIYGASQIQKLRIGIVGAGATGVELAAELHRLVDAGRFTGFKVKKIKLINDKLMLINFILF